MKLFSKNDNISKKGYKSFSLIIIIILIISYLYINSSLFYRIKIILPFSIHLNRQELYMAKGEKFRLYVYGIRIYKWVSYSSTNFRVAGVDFTGRVYAHRTGKSFIIAKVDNKKLKCRVKVIDLNKKKLNLKAGKSFRLTIKGPAVFARYKSSNSKVASVNRFGRVQAKKPGNATITVNVKGKILKCSVTVK